MKSPGLAPLLLAATLFIAPTSTPAADTPRFPEAFRARMMEMFDANGDGRLDEAERARAEKFAAERGLSRDPAQMRGEILRRFDKNGNGRIDEDERPAVMEFLRQRGPMAAAPAASAEPVAPAIEIEQPAPGRLALERLIRAAVAADAEQLKRFDADGDGRLSDEEWSMARLEIQQTFNDGVILRATVADEEKKLSAVAAEVARRREAGVSAPRPPGKQ
ncbi:MAG: hypothetical protein JNK23_11220 [Opitutaceae bacterium]|nr:hypothetical protein [Opitutaceae bacterium]